MASIAISHPHWLRDKLINLLIQTGLERDPRPELAGVPMAYEMAKTDRAKGRDGHRLRHWPDGPAGTGAARRAGGRVAALRAALKATLEDRDFLAETAKSRVPIIYVPGEQVQTMLDRVYASPPSALKAVAAIMQ